MINVDTLMCLTEEGEWLVLTDCCLTGEEG